MLLETAEIYVCKGCGTHTPVHKLVCDDNTGCYYCPECDSDRFEEDKQTHKVVWWSVAKYDTGRAYGGPEEGGWYYTYGTLTMPPVDIRIFDKYEEAVAYEKALWDTCEADQVVRAYVEAMPETHWPKMRPYYC